MEDERWDDLLQSHPQASIFHTRAWMQALRTTYGYQPLAFTTSPPGTPLTNGTPFCKITGLFGKSRLVSLPFSDHCEPLVETDAQLNCLLDHLWQRRERDGLDYVEIRPQTNMAITQEFVPTQSFLLHQLDLRQDLSEILWNTHKDCIQRKVRRAEREGLVTRKGLSESLLSHFYRLLVITRLRHGLPTQPIEWFRNLLTYLGDQLTIRVAYKDRHPVASILTLRFKNVLIYKYGCLNRRFGRLGGMQLLLWQAIQDAKRERLLEFDLGRSECDNSGLIIYKDRWGASRSHMAYHRIGKHNSHPLATVQPSIRKYLWSCAPSPLRLAASRALYRHLG